MKQISEKVMNTFTDLQTEIKANKTVNAETQAKFDKMSDSLTKGLERVQAIETEQKAVQAVLNRVNEAKDKEKDTFLEGQKKIFFDYAIKGERPAGLAEGQKLEVKALRTDNNTSGGYVVIPELAAFVINREFETSPVRQLARVVQTGSNAINILVDDDEATATWVGEGSPSSNTTTPLIGLKTINAHKLDAEPRITTEMLQDAYMDMEGWLKEKLTSKFGRAENTAFVSGNGVNKPRGFLTLSAWGSAGVYERNKLEQINSGATATLTADGLISLQNSLKEVYQPRANFVMKRASFGAVLQLKSTTQYFFSLSLLKDGQLSKQLLGKPVVFADDMTAIGADALAVAYGDFSVGYTVVDKVGLEVLRDPFSAKGFVTFYTTKRVGGDVTNFDAIKLQKLAV